MLTRAETVKKKKKKVFLQFPSTLLWNSSGKHRYNEGVLVQTEWLNPNRPVSQYLPSGLRSAQTNCWFLQSRRI